MDIPTRASRSALRLLCVNRFMIPFYRFGTDDFGCLGWCWELQHRGESRLFCAADAERRGGGFIRHGAALQPSAEPPETVGTTGSGHCAGRDLRSGYTRRPPGLDRSQDGAGEAVAAALLGFSLIAFNVDRLPSLVARLSGSAMAVAGLFGLSSYFLGLDLLYSGYIDIRIAPLVSISLLACAICLWLQTHQSPWRACFDAGVAWRKSKYAKSDSLSRGPGSQLKTCLCYKDY